MIGRIQNAGNISATRSKKTRLHSSGTNRYIQVKSLKSAWGGMAFQYASKNGSSPEASKIDIVSADYTEAVLIRHLEIQKVFDTVISEENAAGSSKVRKQVVRFGNLSRGQMSRLEYFIRGYSSCCV